MDIEKLEPGYKLDWLMAEKVMGWTQEEGAWIDSEGRHCGYTYRWEPSRNIKAAWQVVRKLDLLIIGFDFAHEGIACRMISAKFGVVECKGETETHAICLAAVSAMEANG